MYLLVAIVGLIYWHTYIRILTITRNTYMLRTSLIIHSPRVSQQVVFAAYLWFFNSNSGTKHCYDIKFGVRIYWQSLFLNPRLHMQNGKNKVETC